MNDAGDVASVCAVFAALHEMVSWGFANNNSSNAAIRNREPENNPSTPLMNS